MVQVCEGFTRPECEPCNNIGERRIQYKCVDERIEKVLCSKCISKIFTTSIGKVPAWNW